MWKKKKSLNYKFSSPGSANHRPFCLIEANDMKTSYMVRQYARSCILTKNNVNKTNHC